VQAVVVAMNAVGVVQVVADQIVGVAAMRHLLVPAVRTVGMPRLVPCARMLWGAARRLALQASPRGPGRRHFADQNGERRLLQHAGYPGALRIADHPL
jgi:hypothetical protein